MNPEENQFRSQEIGGNIRILLQELKLNNQHRNVTGLKEPTNIKLKTRRQLTFAGRGQKCGVPV